MRNGRALENLVAILEKQLSNDPDVIIESPKRLADQFTGKQREHDVVLTYRKSHHVLIVAIECKDRSRPVGVSDVEAFITKCRHTRVSQGVIVSASGFHKTAVDKASKLGIRCLTLEDTKRISWLMPNAVVIVHSKRFLSARYTAVPERQPDDNIDNYEIFDSHGTLVRENMIGANLARNSQSFPDGEIGKEVTVDLFFETEGFYIRRPSDKTGLPIKGIAVRTTYITEVQESSFSTSSYIDASGKTVLADVAMANIELNGEQKQVLITDRRDGGSLKLTIK